MATGVIPERWKVGKIKMLLKPNKPAKELSSYSPISLTSKLAKCLEKIMKNRLVKFLDENNKISKFQSGLRAGHCTKDHILRLSQNFQNNFNKNHLTGAVMFDMEKAFDRVWHNGLIYKMHKLKIPNYIIYWVQQFIIDRSFYVQIGNNSSRRFKLKAGVPQGCILSPILFSIYFSDISETINSDKGIYADDLAIWTGSEKFKDIENQLQLDIYRTNIEQLDKYRKFLPKMVFDNKFWQIK